MQQGARTLILKTPQLPGTLHRALMQVENLLRAWNAYAVLMVARRCIPCLPVLPGADVPDFNVFGRAAASGQQQQSPEPSDLELGTDDLDEFAACARPLAA